MRLLLPRHRSEIAPSELYEQERPKPADRPWVMVNMIASIDGATAVEGRSGGLGGPGDRAVFASLRRAADAVLVGASTVRAEHYHPPARADLRIAVVTASGDLDWSWALWRHPRTVVVTTTDAPPMPAVHWRFGTGRVDLAAAIGALGDDGDRVVLVEGGPKLNGQLIAAGLVDELCVTIAPRAVGGSAARISVGEAADAALELQHVAEEDGWLFLRYVASRLTMPTAPAPS